MAQYYIRFLRRESVYEERTCIDEPKSAVEQQAKHAVEVGLADRVEVRNVNDTLIFQWPRTLHPA